ncbi:MFS transporter [Actinosynnema sp. NPDC020468]|uniref:MFS transporter n=1 Tax=Actinosynnema sp. NPDC020468 TaxID=3154488 RepID=UPI0033F031AA
MTTDTLPRTSLWSANFRLYLGARATSLLGDAMLPVALSVGVLAAGHGITGIGYALGAWMAAMALCTLMGGVLADRFTPRRMMVLADLIRLVVQAGIAVAFALGAPALWLIVVLQFLSGVATSMFQPGVASMVPKVAKDVQKANGVLRIAEAITGVLGPAVAGLLVSLFGAAVVFGIDAATYAVSALCLAALRLGDSPVADRAQSYWRQLVEGWQDFRSRNWLWGVIAIWLVYGCFVPGVSLPVTAELVNADYGSTTLGIALGAFGGGGVLGGLVAMRAKPARPLVAGSIGWALFAVYPFTPVFGPPAILLHAGWLVAGFGLAYWGVVWATTVQTHVPEHLLNRVYAYDVSGSLLALTLGRTLAGPLAGAVGPRTLMLLSTALGLVCTGLLLVTPAIRRLRRAN